MKGEQRGNFPISRLRALNTPTLFLFYISCLLPLLFSIFLPLSNRCAVSPPREGADDVIVSAGVSRVSVAIPAEWCHQPYRPQQTNIKHYVSHQRTTFSKTYTKESQINEALIYIVPRKVPLCVVFFYFKGEKSFIVNKRDGVYLHTYKVRMLTRGNWVSSLIEPPPLNIFYSVFCWACSGSECSIIENEIGNYRQSKILKTRGTVPTLCIKCNNQNMNHLCVKHSKKVRPKAVS